ncbi:MAG: trypsin-like peptidase domain-containing protein [Eubacteriales bacterium]|nr:trypsin-like peptidase domain-containing protein [Eubacteriales bacterium]
MRSINKRTIVSFVLAIAMLLGLGIYASADENTLSQDEISQIINTQTDKEKITSPVIEVSNKARESIVGVNNYQTRRTDFYGYGYGYFNTPKQSAERLVGTGSGVVVSKYGHIITNHHVVEEASRVSVSFDGEEYPAEVVASDASIDISILLAPDIKLPAAPLGDSDQLQIGEYAIVIGNPLGEQFERTVTVGFVSALGRTVEDQVSDRYGRRSTVKNQMIQVDAAINQGNSGGGMFNTLGQLQGIPARKYDNSGNPLSGFLGIQQASIDNIGMCIPINVAKPMLENVLKNYDASNVQKAEDEQNPPPKLGVTITTLSASANQKLDGTLPNGAYVLKVEDDSPASAAGIKKGDIIVEVDNTVINNSDQLVETLAAYKEGNEINIKVFRTKGTDDVAKLNSIGESEYVDLKVTLRLLGNIDM